MNEEVKIIETGKEIKDGQDKCPYCGASEVAFSEKFGKLYCNYCGSTFDGNKLDGIENDIFNLKGMIIGSGANNINKEANDIITLKCGGCGAEVVIDTKFSTNARCHWCRSTLSINSKIENGAVPDAILPFKVKKDAAKKSIEDFVGKRKFFALPRFKKEFTTENIMGVYFPYMIVDANAHCFYEGEGEHLVRKYKVDDSTRYDSKVYHVKREFDIAINDLSIESNSDRIDKNREDKTNNIINSVMPFDTENCIQFKSNYLNGFTSERRDTDVSLIQDKVNSQICDVARHAINEDLKYYDRGIRWEKENNNIIGTQWITAYLPVWLYSYYEFKNGKNLLHYVAVNARTKETMGSIPINKSLLFIISAIIEFFAGLLAIFLFINSDSDGDGKEYIFALFSAGFIFYFFMYSRYRNKEARHTYEKETDKKIKNIQKEDIYIKNLRGQSNSQIKGCNNYRIDGEKIKIKKKG